MADKHYGLTNRPNEGIKNNVPDWMDEILNIKVEKNVNPFKDIDDPILNPNFKKTEKCVCCGAVLQTNEIKKCKNCL